LTSRTCFSESRSVGRRNGELPVDVRAARDLATAVVAELDPAALDLVVQVLVLFVGQLEQLGERHDLRQFEAA
jgi:hypothetical protein